MRQKLLSIITITVCLILMAAAAVTAVATGTDENGSESSSSQNTQTEPSSSSSATESDGNETESSSSAQSSSQESSSSESSSQESSSAQSSNESSKESSSKEEASEPDEDEDEDEDETSSSGTSSRKPITSVGAGDGKTFISETGSEIAEGNSGDVSIPGDTAGTDPDGEISPDDEHFEGEATTFASSIYKVIWIPILISLLCIGGLIYINLIWSKQHGLSKGVFNSSGKGGSSKGSRRGAGSKSSGVSRRGSRK